MWDPQGRWAFAGVFHGACWNGQALLSADLACQASMLSFLWASVRKSFDFILLQETHATTEQFLIESGVAGYEFFS